MHGRRGTFAIASLLSVALALAGCTSDSSDDTGGDATSVAPVVTSGAAAATTSTTGEGESTVASSAATTSTATPVELGPSDVGVTAETVKVGFLMIDLTQTKALLGDLGADLDVQEAMYRAFVDAANADGGINGRRIEPVFTSFDPVAGDATTACNLFTEDEQVFAVVSNGIYGPPVLCITQQHGTPLVNVGGFIDEYYEQSNGLLYTLLASKNRAARNTIAALEQEGFLQDRTIGVLTSQAGDDNVAVNQSLVPTLEQLDHPVARVADLAADTGAAAAQIAVEVTQMREAGVDLVFLSTNAFFASVFVQTADEQGYHPEYALSDADDNIADYVIGRMPATFEARGFTVKRIGEFRGDAPEPEVDAACREVAEEATGTTLDRGSSEYEFAMNACNQLDVFVAGATAAGAELTRTSWADAMQALGEFPLAYANGGSFTPTKSEAADWIRPVTADTACGCWLPAGDFQPMRY